MTVAEAGTYRLRIGYATSTNQVVAYLRVGDQPADSWKRMAMPGTGGWETVRTRSYDVELPAGTSVLWLSGSTRGRSTDNWINYDYIDIGKLKPEVLLGDVNGDGSVNSLDARLILQYSVEAVTLEDWQLRAADMGQNGSVDSSDARLVLQAAVG